MTDRDRPDPDQVTAILKDFQSRTAEYAFQRLYRDERSSGRFLIADEVGLGKTLVARGVIAHAADHLWDRTDQINIVYICSNRDIASQNISRLTLDEKSNHSMASRLTLHPIHAHKFRDQKLNFVSFTPGTSLDLKSSLGRKKERVLLYHLLKEPWDLTGKAPLNVLQGNARAENFRPNVRSFDERIDSRLHEKYVDKLSTRPELREEFEALCDVYTRYDKDVSDRQSKRRAQLVGELRSLLAEVCVEDLEPNLIILDEFQRFKYLLDPDAEESQLAQLLFEYSDANTAAKVLLLSATPYKMYTTYDDTDENHYEDFLQTIQFLSHDENHARIAELLDDYRQQLYRIGEVEMESLLEVKNELQDRLLRVMARTERLADSPDRNGMVEEKSPTSPLLEATDVESFVTTQRINRQVEGTNVLEYWKSAPYLLNFMDGYEMSDGVDEALSSPDESQELVRQLSQGEEHLLDWDDIYQYDSVNPQNARLRYLWNDVIDTPLWKLLWIPPTINYYEFGGPYGDVDLQTATKRLVFSRWKVVPKAVTSLTSYEAERRITSTARPDATYDPDARSRRGNLLQLGRDIEDDRLTGLPLFTLLYPSISLARSIDPLEIARDHVERKSELSVAGVLNRTQDRLEENLIPLVDHIRGEEKSASSERGDERWYWAAPLLLDSDGHQTANQAWLTQNGLAEEWIPEFLTTGDDPPKYWPDHLHTFQEIGANAGKLGPPPDDLSEVLAYVSLGSPAICALRAIGRVVGDGISLANPEIRLTAARIGWAFRSLFNLPETTALLRGIDSSEPYWQRVLEYNVNGNLQAMLDEYVHLLCDVGYEDMDAESISDEIGSTVVQTVGLRTTTATVDTYDVQKENVAVDSHRIRRRFALQYGDAPSADISEKTRADDVRAAFNSPFWPHVLVSTSIGQEGLDFHPYCHAVIHWNLPYNPVDLEQREGRVHRFKGHGVRKNLATDYRNTIFTSSKNDPWEAIFSEAEADDTDGDSAIVPYWVYNTQNGAKIERHFPFLPYTSDRSKASSLKRSLTLYRMAFGQPRQQDLVEFLATRFRSEEISLEEIVDDLSINLEPPRT